MIEPKLSEAKKQIGGRDAGSGDAADVSILASRAQPTGGTMEIDIKEFVKAKVDEIDIREIVEKEVREIIEKDAREKIRATIEVEASRIIAEELTKQFLKPVIVDDGWGSSKKTYETFEDFFRATLEKRMKDSWEIQKKIDHGVRERVDAMIASEKDRITEKIATEILGEKK